MIFAFEDGRLTYSRHGEPPAALIALTPTIFQHGAADFFRLRFDTDGDGKVFRVTGMYEDGRRDESLRD